MLRFLLSSQSENQRTLTLCAFDHGSAVTALINGAEVLGRGGSLSVLGADDSLVISETFPAELPAEGEATGDDGFDIRAGLQDIRNATQ